MAFDPTTATLVEEPKFDPSTAVPVESTGPLGYVGKGEFAPEAGSASVPLASKMTPAEKQDVERLKTFVNAPLIKLGTVPQQASPILQVEAGLQNTLNRTVEGISTPTNLALLAATPVRTVGRLAGILFGAKMLEDARSAVRETIAPDKTVQERIESGGRTLTDVLFGTAGVKYGLGGEISATEPNRETSAVPTERGITPVSETEVKTQEGDTRTSPPQKSEAQTVTPPVEAAAVSGPESPPAAAPSDFTPAIRTKEGTVVGKQGQTHDEIIKSQPNATELMASEPERGFVDKEGTFKTRDETSAALGETDPMHSERLREMQGITPTTPTSLKNSIVDQEREARGLQPIMQVAKKSFGTTWDNALKKIDENPRIQDQLIEELKNKPRAITDEEDAMLLHRKIDLQNSFDKASENLIKATESGDQSSVIENRVKVSQLSDELNDLDNVGKQAGTETARGLAARRMMVNEDYSLARMEMRKRAANDGKPLSDQQRSEIQKLNAKIKETQDLLDQHLARTELKDHFDSLIEASKNEAKQALKEKRGIGSFLEEQANKARERIAARGTRLMTGIDPVDLADRAIIGADYIAKGINKFADWSDRMITEFGEAIKPFLQDLYDRAKEFHESNLRAFSGREDSRLKALKTRTRNSIFKLQEKLDTGDFTKEQRQPIKLDQEAFKLKAQNERLKQEFQKGLLKDLQQQRSPLEKAQDTLVKWRRGFILSAPTVLGKLTSAAAQRMTFTPAEEVIGGGLSKLFPEVAKRAPREGGLSIKAESQAITEGFTKGMKDSWDVLRTGKSDLDVLYGKAGGQLPPEAIDFIGHIHGALKTVTKRNEFARSFQKRVEFGMSNGIDVSDPMIQSKYAIEAYKDANRSIFMQDNRVVSAYKRFLSSFDQPEKSTGKVPLASKAVGTTARVLLPIVKVPTNIIAETMQYAVGSVTGSARLARAYAKGVENLKPEEAEIIMRSLKKGSLGAAALALGYFNADKIGGYYQPGQKRDPGDVKFGSVRLYGVDIPTWLVHNPLLETLQIGATVRRVADSKLKKSDAVTQGIPQGVLAAGLGVTEEVPFVREMTEVSKAFDPKSRGAFVGELAKSLAVPQAVEFTARQMDKGPTGEVIQRKPENVLQHIETGIPGLRKKVPEKTQRKRKGSIRRD